MKRTAVNPWSWSLGYGYNQGVVIEGASRQLVCAGQTSVDADGNPLHAGDMRSQMTVALDNLEAVVRAAAMELSDVTRLTIYATDVDQTVQNFDVIAERFAAGDVAPPMTLLGVTRLAIPDLMVEIEATATA